MNKSLSLNSDKARCSHQSRFHIEVGEGFGLHLLFMQAVGCSDCRWRASNQEPLVSIWTLIAPHQSALSDTLDWAAGSSGIRQIPFTFWKLARGCMGDMQGRHFKTSSVIYGHWWISFWSQLGRNDLNQFHMFEERKHPRISPHSHKPTPINT